MRGPRNVKPGDEVDVDDYINMLEEAGFDADYENLVDESSGFVAQVRVRDRSTGEMEDHAVFDKSAGHDCMMRSVNRDLSMFE